jgi:hypothetical protein
MGVENIADGRIIVKTRISEIGLRGSEPSIKI